MTRKVCSRAGCPVLVDSGAYRGLCVAHKREQDRARGSREARGYGSAHRAERARLAAAVDRGERVLCWRCQEPIKSSVDLHLGHDDLDRTITRGAECASCNLRAAGRSAHAQ